MHLVSKESIFIFVVLKPAWSYIIIFISIQCILLITFHSLLNKVYYQNILTHNTIIIIIAYIIIQYNTYLKCKYQIGNCNNICLYVIANCLNCSCIELPANYRLPVYLLLINISLTLYRMKIVHTYFIKLV